MPTQTHKQQYEQGMTDFFAGRERNKKGSWEFYQQGFNRAKELAYLNSFYRYCMLPGGNADQFPDIDAELKRLGVTFSYCQAQNNDGRIYRISSVEGSKLPTDNYKGVRGVPYLPDAPDSGHSLYHMYLDFVEEQRVEWGYSDWFTVTP